MQEDKLTHSERVRLECLNQAIQSSGAHVGRSNSTESIIKRAQDFEDFVVYPRPSRP